MNRARVAATLAAVLLAAGCASRWRRLGEEAAPFAGKARVREARPWREGPPDRCATCHVPAPAPPQSLRHPWMPHPGDLLRSHPPERFGCTPCHGGRGDALSPDAAHGRPGLLEAAALPGDVPALKDAREREAACGACHLGGDTGGDIGGDLDGAPKLSRGRRLYVELGCVGCHRAPGSPSTDGPDLALIASRDGNLDGRVDRADEELLLTGLKDPDSRRQGSPLPHPKLEADEAEALAIVMMSFAGPVPDPLTGTVAHPGHFPDPTLIVPAPARPEPANLPERGRWIVEVRGCAGCHGRGLQGGVKNGNARGGEVPATAKVADTVFTQREEADRFLALAAAGPIPEDQEWLKSARDMRLKILEGKRSEKEDPKGPQAPLAMPSWKSVLTPRDAEAVLAYLITLFPADAWKSWDEEEKPKKNGK